MTVYNVQDHGPFQYLGVYCGEDAAKAEAEKARLTKLAPAGDWRIVSTTYSK